MCRPLQSLQTTLLQIHLQGEHLKRARPPLSKPRLFGNSGLIAESVVKSVLPYCLAGVQYECNYQFNSNLKISVEF